MTNHSEAGVLLVDPRFPHNVGTALRACALLGAQTLYWTGSRVPPPEEWSEGARLPREERMKCYANTRLRHIKDSSLMRIGNLHTGYVPVCVEITDGAEDLRDFVHPEKPLYVFGPEDGGVPKGVRNHCHRFVRIPAWDEDERTPYNLATAVFAVLYDRLFKATRGHPLSYALHDPAPVGGVREWNDL
jgi:tRNA(Leu) C34 or U34 (ribose-2'-O)-methylase TrmL